MKKNPVLCELWTLLAELEESSVVIGATTTTTTTTTTQKSVIPFLPHQEESQTPNIPQKASSAYPDQNNSEKYLNNDQDILDKVVNTPVFYKDAQQFTKYSLV